LPPTSAFDQAGAELAGDGAVAGSRNERLLCASARLARRWRDDFRRHELACRIADCFDQYLVYRPDWIEKWEAGEEGHWQAELWRRLARTGEAHRAQVQEQFRKALRRGEVDRRRLPERVAVVGVAALPPLYLDLLAELARFIDVHLFVLNPCQEYWGDIRAERDLARLGEDIDPEDCLSDGRQSAAGFTGQAGAGFY
jgi:exodeoxyribonuclease V gamma subunit